MEENKSIRVYLLSVLILISLGGWLFHIGIHPPKENLSNLVPFITGILSVFAVPVLFLYKRTYHFGYILNGMTALVGTVLMTHFSIAHWPKVLTLATLFTRTLIADIFILWCKFAAGMVLFELQASVFGLGFEKQGKWYRYPSLGWWGIHLTLISIIYTIGHLLGG